MVQSGSGLVSMLIESPEALTPTTELFETTVTTPSHLTVTAVLNALSLQAPPNTSLSEALVPSAESVPVASALVHVRLMPLAVRTVVVEVPETFLSAVLMIA